MGSVDFNMTATVRSELGKGASRRLRHQGKIPVILYGSDKEPVSLTMDHDHLFHHIEHEAFYSHILTINIDGVEEKVVLKDLQRHPAKPLIQHADFMRVRENEKIRMHVPLHFTNESSAPGVKSGGGIISHNIIEIEVTCLPNDLPEYLEVNMGSVELDQAVHLSDIQLPPGVELAALLQGTEHDLPIASIHKSRASIEAGNETEDGEGSVPEQDQ